MAIKIIKPGKKPDTGYIILNVVSPNVPFAIVASRNA